MTTHRRGGMSDCAQYRNRPQGAGKADISDFRPSLPDRGLYIDNDTNQRLITLIERLFCQHVACDRDQCIDVPLTDIEYDIINAVCGGRHMTPSELMRECLHDMCGKYHKRNRNHGKE